MVLQFSAVGPESHLAKNKLYLNLLYLFYAVPFTVTPRDISNYHKNVTAPHKSLFSLPQTFLRSRVPIQTA